MGRSCADALVGTVDTVVLVDRDADLLATAGHELAATGANIEIFVADVTDRVRLSELATLVAGLGGLRPVAHAANISPTMADWRPIFAVDLTGDTGATGSTDGVGAGTGGAPGADVQTGDRPEGRPASDERRPCSADPAGSVGERPKLKHKRTLVLARPFLTPRVMGGQGSVERSSGNGGPSCASMAG
jgi:NAD(P)-dependent dehydrogenase (short-subunit alcohol dehydrogenase family)